MRVLLINYEYPPIGAGAANATYHIAKSLVKQGHGVFVLTSCFQYLKGWSIEDRIRVFRCLSVRKKASQASIAEMLAFLVSAFLVLPGLLQRQKINAMIVFFSFPCGPLGLWGKHVAGVPYIISLRGGDVPGTEPSLDLIHSFLRPLRRLIFRKSLAVVANSEGLKALSEKADPFPVKLIPNGVDIDFFVRAPKRNKRTSFLFVGRFREQKNLFFLLEHMDAVARRVKNDFEIHLVGDGPLASELKQYADTLKIRDRIYWHAWCDKEELKQHYQNADCILNPSLYEGMPNVLLEAMACGLPVIASNVAGNETVVRHGETGFLFDLSRPDDFIKAVVQVLKDKNLAYTMGQKGKACVEKAFSWNTVANKYIQLLKQE